MESIRAFASSLVPADGARLLQQSPAPASASSSDHAGGGSASASTFWASVFAHAMTCSRTLCGTCYGQAFVPFLAAVSAYCFGRVPEGIKRSSFDANTRPVMEAGVACVLLQEEEEDGGFFATPASPKKLPIWLALDERSTGHQLRLDSLERKGDRPVFSRTIALHLCTQTRVVAGRNVLEIKVKEQGGGEISACCGGGAFDETEATGRGHGMEHQPPSGAASSASSTTAPASEASTAASSFTAQLQKDASQMFSRASSFAKSVLKETAPQRKSLTSFVFKNRKGGSAESIELTFETLRLIFDKPQEAQKWGAMIEEAADALFQHTSGNDSTTTVGAAIRVDVPQDQNKLQQQLQERQRDRNVLREQELADRKARNEERKRVLTNNGRLGMQHTAQAMAQRAV
ncbi:unnamed protein product [Amoebophrya sp. A120]|nr:unnamed protein product [Amoebophrya sp. A120]|eukprot:GSA120T00003349001.1